MKKLIAIMCSVFAFGAFAAEQKHSWFDMDIGDIGTSSRNWPTDGSNYEAYLCFVTNTAAGVFAESPKRIVVNAEEPMSVVPKDSAPIDIVTYAEISAMVQNMETFSSSELPEIPQGAKTAVIVVDSGTETNFWVASGCDDALCWTNTEVAVDIASPIEIKVTASFHADYTETRWTFGEQVFSCRIPKTEKFTGVAFQGNCELSSCWGDAQTFGELVNFYITGIPEDVIVTATTTNGDALVKSDSGVYRYLSGETVNLVFSLPEGWRYADGESEWNDVIAQLQDGEYVPFEGRGIFDTDIGPIGSWMVVPYDGPARRFDTLDAALASLKDYCALMSCYSEVKPEIIIAADGKSITVNGDEKTAKPRYHFFSAEGLPVLQIDEEEATITSISENATDSSKMSVGSIENSCEDFNYSVIYADDVEFTVGLGETESVPGDGEKLELVAPKGDKGKRFYRIRITD